MGLHKLEVCKKGLHPLKGKNAVPKADGTRQCRLCRAETRKKNKAKKKKEAKELAELIDRVARY